MPQQSEVGTELESNTLYWSHTGYQIIY